jgi:hypothetical protein
MNSENYVKAFSAVMGMYGLQMLAVPGKMITDHFEAPATPLLKFWIRGSSVGFLGLVYCLQQMPTADAVKVATVASAATGMLYPWNAKFTFVGEKLPVKYPMHYVPEVLMAVLTLAGAYVMQQ